MIIRCETCYSIFKLNSSLIKDGGLRVRCSKCRTVFRVYPPQLADPRKSPRVKTRNLVSYFSFDKDGKLTSEGMGIVLDISEDGILIETPNNIKLGLLVMAVTDKMNNLIEIKGEIIRIRRKPNGMFFIGIKFIGVEERVSQFVATLIKEYSFRRENLYYSVKQKNAHFELAI